MPAVHAQAGNTTQYLFVVQGGPNPDVLTYSVDQTAGALTELAASPFSANDTTYPLALAVSLERQYLYAI